MNRKAIIFTVVSIVSVIGLSMGAGLLIYNMSKGPTEDKKETINESVSQSEETSTEAETEPETEPESSIYDHEIKEVSDEVLQSIAANYSDDIVYYETSGDKDENKISKEVLRVYTNFNGKFENNVHFFQKNDMTLGFVFVLVTEYGTNTSYILDQLSIKEVTATFFVTTNYAFQNPKIIQRIIDEGHTLGSLGASVSEKGIAQMSLSEQMSSHLTAQQYMNENFNYDMKLFYFATNYYSEQAIALAQAMGYTVVFPTVTYNDYDASTTIDSNHFLQSMEDAISNKAVFAFHTTNSASLLVVRNVIPDMVEQGYTFTRIE